MLTSCKATQVKNKIRIYLRGGDEQMMLLRRILGRIQNKRQEVSERFSTLFIFFPQNFLRNLLSSYRNI